MTVQVVYLDQNAASFLAKSSSESIWREIKTALVEGFRDRRLICPLPFECVIESSPKPVEFRRSIRDLFWLLSEGVAFKDFTEMSSELTLALVRPTANWAPWNIWKPIWADMESPTQNVRANLKSGKARMMERMKSFVRSPRIEGTTIRELFHAVAEQRSVWLCKDLDCLLEGQKNEARLNYPWLIKFLIASNLSSAEINALKLAVLHHGWAKIPIHTFNILLGAKWEYDSIRGGASSYEPNDEIDRMRAATALSYADYFITEGGLADLCRRANVGEFCSTVVLSVRKPQKVLEALVGNLS